MTNVPIEKTNLTNFQRIFLNEKSHDSPTQGRVRPEASVFEVIHSIEPTEDGPIDNLTETKDFHVNLEQNLSAQSAPLPVVCNPLLLTVPSYDPTRAHLASMTNRQCSSTSTSLCEGEFNSSMHINRIFEEDDGSLSQVQETNQLTFLGIKCSGFDFHFQTSNDPHPKETDFLMDAFRSIPIEEDRWEASTTSTPVTITMSGPSSLEENIIVQIPISRESPTDDDQDLKSDRCVQS